MSDLYEHEQHGYIARPCNSERPGPWCLEHQYPQDGPKEASLLTDLLVMYCTNDL